MTAHTTSLRSAFLTADGDTSAPHAEVTAVTNCPPRRRVIPMPAAQAPRQLASYPAHSTQQPEAAWSGISATSREAVPE